MTKKKHMLIDYGCVSLSLWNPFNWLCNLQSIFYSPASLQVIQWDLLKGKFFWKFYLFGNLLFYGDFPSCWKTSGYKMKEIKFFSHISRNIILPGILFLLTCPDGEVWNYEAHDTSLEMWELQKHHSPSCIIRAMNLPCDNVGNCTWEWSKELPRTAMNPNYYSL